MGRGTPHKKKRKVGATAASTSSPEGSDSESQQQSGQRVPIPTKTGNKRGRSDEKKASPIKKEQASPIKNAGKLASSSKSADQQQQASSSKSADQQDEQEDGDEEMSSQNSEEESVAILGFFDSVPSAVNSNRLVESSKRSSSPNKSIAKVVTVLSGLSTAVAKTAGDKLAPKADTADLKTAVEKFATDAERNVGEAWLQVPRGRAMAYIDELNRISTTVTNNVAVLSFGLVARAEMERICPDLASGKRTLSNLQDVLDFLAEPQDVLHPLYGNAVALRESNGKPVLRSDFLRESLKFTHALLLWTASNRDQGETVAELEQLPDNTKEEASSKAAWTNDKVEGKNIASLSFRILLWALQPDDVWPRLQPALFGLDKTKLLILHKTFSQVGGVGFACALFWLQRIDRRVHLTCPQVNWATSVLLQHVKDNKHKFHDLVDREEAAVPDQLAATNLFMKALVLTAAESAGTKGEKNAKVIKDSVKAALLKDASDDTDEICSLKLDDAESPIHTTTDLLDVDHCKEFVDRKAAQLQKKADEALATTKKQEAARAKKESETKRAASDDTMQTAEAVRQSSGEREKTKGHHLRPIVKPDAPRSIYVDPPGGGRGQRGHRRTPSDVSHTKSVSPAKKKPGSPAQQPAKPIPKPGGPAEPIEDEKDSDMQDVVEQLQSDAGVQAGDGLADLSLESGAVGATQGLKKGTPAPKAPSPLSQVERNRLAHGILHPDRSPTPRLTEAEVDSIFDTVPQVSEQPPLVVAPVAPSSFFAQVTNAFVAGAGVACRALIRSFGTGAGLDFGSASYASFLAAFLRRAPSSHIPHPLGAVAASPSLAQAEEAIVGVFLNVILDPTSKEQDRTTKAWTHAQAAEAVVHRAAAALSSEEKRAKGKTANGGAVRKAKEQLMVAKQELAMAEEQLALDRVVYSDFAHRTLHRPRDQGEWDTQIAFTQSAEHRSLQQKSRVDLFEQVIRAADAADQRGITLGNLGLRSFKVCGLSTLAQIRVAAQHADDPDGAVLRQSDGSVVPLHEALRIDPKGDEESQVAYNARIHAALLEPILPEDSLALIKRGFSTKRSYEAELSNHRRAGYRVVISDFGQSEVRTGNKCARAPQPADVPAVPFGYDFWFAYKPADSTAKQEDLFGLGMVGLQVLLCYDLVALSADQRDVLKKKWATWREKRAAAGDDINVFAFFTDRNVSLSAFGWAFNHAVNGLRAGAAQYKHLYAALCQCTGKLGSSPSCSELLSCVRGQLEEDLDHEQQLREMLRSRGLTEVIACGEGDCLYNAVQASIMELKNFSAVRLLAHGALLFDKSPLGRKYWEAMLMPGTSVVGVPVEQEDGRIFHARPHDPEYFGNWDDKETNRLVTRTLRRTKEQRRVLAEIAEEKIDTLIMFFGSDLSFSKAAAALDEAKKLKDAAAIAAAQQAFDAEMKKARDSIGGDVVQDNEQAERDRLVKGLIRAQIAEMREINVWNLPIEENYPELLASYLGLKLTIIDQGLDGSFNPTVFAEEGTFEEGQLLPVTLVRRHGHYNATEKITDVFGWEPPKHVPTESADDPSSQELVEFRLIDTFAIKKKSGKTKASTEQQKKKDDHGNDDGSGSGSGSNAKGAGGGDIAGDASGDKSSTAKKAASGKKKTARKPQSQKQRDAMYKQFAKQLTKRHPEADRSQTQWLKCLDVKQVFKPPEDQLESIREAGYDVVSFSAEGQECFWHAGQALHGFKSKEAAMAALKAAVEAVKSDDECCVKAMQAPLNLGSDDKATLDDLSMVKSLFLARVGEKGAWGGMDEFHVLGCASDSPCAATQLYSFDLEEGGTLHPLTNATSAKRSAYLVYSNKNHWTLLVQPHTDGTLQYEFEHGESDLQGVAAASELQATFFPDAAATRQMRDEETADVAKNKQGAIDLRSPDEEEKSATKSATPAAVGGQKTGEKPAEANASTPMDTDEKKKSTGDAATKAPAGQSGEAVDSTSDTKTGQDASSADTTKPADAAMDDEIVGIKSTEESKQVDESKAAESASVDLETLSSEKFVEHVFLSIEKKTRMVWQWLAFVKGQIKENDEAARPLSRAQLAPAILKSWTDAIVGKAPAPEAGTPVYEKADKTYVRDLAVESIKKKEEAKTKKEKKLNRTEFDAAVRGERNHVVSELKSAVKTLSNKLETQ